MVFGPLVGVSAILHREKNISMMFGIFFCTKSTVSGARLKTPRTPKGTDGRYKKKCGCIHHELFSNGPAQTNLQKCTPPSSPGKLTKHLWKKNFCHRDQPIFVHSALNILNYISATKRFAFQWERLIITVIQELLLINPTAMALKMKTMMMMMMKKCLILLLQSVEMTTYLMLLL